ncbi:MAG: outer membrane protein [Candidatus Midichloriaceae bacterium]
MSNILRFSMLVLVIVLTSNEKSYADNKNIYLRVDFGIPYYNKLSNDYDKARLHKGQFYNIGLGYKFDNKIRSDITLSRLNKAKFSFSDNSSNQNFESKSHFNVNSTVAMANIYYDLINKDKFNIYVGSGVGVSQNSVDNYLSDVKSKLTLAADPVIKMYNKSNKNCSFAYGISIGTSFKITNSSFINLGYKYYDLGTIKHEKIPGIKTSKDLKSSLRAHTINFGLRVFL